MSFPSEQVRTGRVTVAAGEVFPISRVGYIGRGDGITVGWGPSQPPPEGYLRVGRNA
jgi:hypothetical protein